MGCGYGLRQTGIEAGQGERGVHHPRSATGIGTIVGLADKCLDIANAQSDDGTVVQLTTCHQMKAKIWNLLKDKMIQPWASA